MLLVALTRSLRSLRSGEFDGVRLRRARRRSAARPAEPDRPATEGELEDTPPLGLPPERDRGSVLMLMPAAVLIVIILGSIAVDFAVVFLAQRELSVTAAAAANDATTYGVDADYYRATGNYRLDRDRVLASVRSTLVAKRLCGEVNGDVAIDGNAVTVHLTRTVDYIFAKAVPGADHGADVEATDRAEAAGAPPPGSDLSTSFSISC